MFLSVFIFHSLQPLAEKHPFLYLVHIFIAVCLESPKPCTGGTVIPMVFVLTGTQTTCVIQRTRNLI